MNTSKTKIGFLLVGCWFLSGQVFAQSVVPKVELDYPLVAVGKKVTLYALIDFQVAQAEKIEKRPHINLALVIDRSGSMADRGKIGYAKKAAKIVVDSLKPSDRIAVVEYDDRVSVLWPSSLVESPRTIKRMIDRLSPRDMTNLTGGMLKGVDEVEKNVDPDLINRVIVLSDGKANRGVTNPHAIKHLVRQAKAKGVHISSMGLGVDYNEDLMEAIAEAGGGNYYFIEHPTQMSRIFKNELSILFATVAKDVKLEYVDNGLVQKAEFIGFVAKKKGVNLELEPEDFYANESRSLVLKIQIEPQEAGRLSLGKIRLSYFDVLQNQAKTVEQDLVAEATNDLAQVEKARNDKVVAESTLFEADHKHAQSIRLFEKGHKKQALQQINALNENLKQKNRKLKNKTISTKIEALGMESDQMSEAEKTTWARYRYLKSSKIRYYQSKKGKRGLYVLQEGDSGREVEDLQRNLQRLNVYSGPIDGIFDAEVTEAVKAYQRQQNLDDDGVVGPRTMKKLGVY
jgi:Ca-activated chloride channel family protein